MPDKITIKAPEEMFSPVQYNNFRFGGFIYETEVQEGETPEEAYRRGFEFLVNMMRESYPDVRDEFLARYQVMSDGHLFPDYE